jgi:hypothetical protein
MNHWLLATITEKRSSALKSAENLKVYGTFYRQENETDFTEITPVANALELVVIELILDKFEENDEMITMMRACATDAFRLFRVVPLPQDPIKASCQLLKISTLAILGDCEAELAGLFELLPWPALPLDSDDWGMWTWATITESWLRLIRKKDPEDLDTVLKRVADLRNKQEHYEKAYLDNAGSAGKSAALELIGLYHLAKAAEIMAQYFKGYGMEDNARTDQLLRTHFGQVSAVCRQAVLVDLETIALLLGAAAAKLAAIPGG